MSHQIRYDIRTPGPYNRFPSEVSIGELEKIMQEAFKTNGMKVVPEYFIESSNAYPEKLSFFIFPRDKEIISANNGVLKGSLVGALIATKENVGDFKFTYYDKIGVIPTYQRNGIMRSMIECARKVSDGKKDLPALLRTSSQELDKKYLEQSDIQVKLNNWHIHGFGFLDKKTEAELFKNAKDMFYLAAQYVASKPKTVVTIEPSFS